MTGSPFILGLWFVVSMSATAASPSAPTSRPEQSPPRAVYSVTHVGIPVVGSCEWVSQRTNDILDQVLARDQENRVLSARCIPFGGDPDAWLLLDVLVADQDRTLPAIISTLRELGVSTNSEISYDPVQPHKDSVTVVLGDSPNAANAGDSREPNRGVRRGSYPAEPESVVDIGSSTSQGRKVLKFKTGDVFVIHAATGEEAAVQFVIVGVNHVEYRFRYRPSDSAQLVSGHDRAIERYRIAGQDSEGDHLTELLGHDVTLRIGKLRAEWSSAGPDEGFVYYDPSLASIRPVKGLDFDKLP